MLSYLSFFSPLFFFCCVFSFLTCCLSFLYLPHSSWPCKTFSWPCKTPCYLLRLYVLFFCKSYVMTSSCKLCLVSFFFPTQLSFSFLVYPSWAVDFIPCTIEHNKKIWIHHVWFHQEWNIQGNSCGDLYALLSLFVGVMNVNLE